MRKLIIAASIVATLGAVAPATPQDSAELSTRLEATLKDSRARYGLPGATAAIVLPTERSQKQQPVLPTSKRDGP